MHTEFFYVLVGTITAVIGIYKILKLRAPRQICILELEAKVCEIKKARRPGLRREQYDYTPVYEYRVGGRRYRATDGYFAYTCPRKVGDKVRAFCDPDNPQVFYIPKGGTELLFSVVMVCLGFLCAVFGICMT